MIPIVSSLIIVERKTSMGLRTGSIWKLQTGDERSEIPGQASNNNNKVPEEKWETSNGAYLNACRRVFIGIWK